jgi:DNA-binding winged helix-turn-helix (wHTH) protein
MNCSYLIAGWCFDPTEPKLRGDSGEQHLEDRAARVLTLLCKRRGEVVSKDELIANVWGGRSVSANSVSIVMGSLRRALGDDPSNPTIIVTVARRGYRLVEADRPASVSGTVRSPFPEGYHARIVLWSSAVIGLAIIVALIFLAFRPATELTLSVEPPLNATGQHSLDELAASLAPVVLHGVGRLERTILLDGSGGEKVRVIIRSKLIMWNGAPELALSATDANAHTVVWTRFAAGPPTLLARHVDEQILTLAPHLPR